ERSRTMLLFLKHPKETAMIAGLTAAGSLSFYAYTTYIQKFLVNTSGFTKTQATEINAGALLIFMCIQPLAGWLSDRIGRKKVLAGSFGLAAVMAYPLFSTLGATTNEGAAFGLVLLGLVVISGYTAISAVIKAELFPAHIRALGVALPYAVANAAFGGTAEYVALWFKAQGDESRFYIYLSLMAAIACVIALFMRDTQRDSLIHED
ncbi:MAG: MFS transporter, partial [Caulobacterales bacterium]